MKSLKKTVSIGKHNKNTTEPLAELPNAAKTGDDAHIDNKYCREAFGHILHVNANLKSRISLSLPAHSCRSCSLC